MDLQSLNEKQREAVEYLDGPLLVLAGAGSGKTRVLTYKIAHIIDSKEAWPSEILAITFTNKASREMKERIRKLIGERAIGLWMGTFHSICVKILRRHAELVGYTKDFIIYDTADQKSVLKGVVKDLRINEDMYPVKNLQAYISNAKNMMISPEDYTDHFRDGIVADVYREYEKRLRKNNGMDFDNLILETIRLLRENKAVLNEYRDKFKYVLVDEYQDTNKAQYLFVSLLTKGKGNVFVVGDSDQSIYGWRGADIRNINDFKKDFTGAKVIKLERNYRSTSNILNAANAVIENNRDRFKKNLWTDESEGEKIRIYSAANEYEEADYVVSSIDNGIRTGRAAEEFAILYRTNAQSRVLEEKFRLYGIPYKIIGGLKFFERAEVKDIISYLRVIANPQDEVSIDRTINSPKRGIGAKTLEKLKASAIAFDKPLFEVMKDAVSEGSFSAKITDGLKSYTGVIEKSREALEMSDAYEIAISLVVDSGYLKHLENQNTIESRSRIDNINELINDIKEFTLSSEDTSLSEYLASISLQSDQDQIEEEEKSVTMMTLHSSKGLEYPVVFLVGLEEGLFPSGRSFDNKKELEEERRLCYVGITRAMEELTIAHAAERTKFGQRSRAMPSRFLSELPDELVSRMGVAEKPKEFESPAAYDFLRARKEEVKKDIKKGSFTAGAKVKHKVFGEGVIASVDPGNVAVIVFDKVGLKKLALDFAPLKLI